MVFVDYQDGTDPCIRNGLTEVMMGQDVLFVYAILLKEGLVLAIEPMINLGRRAVKQLSDGWTIVTADGKPSAHYEHDVVVRKGKAEVLSTFEFVEEVIKVTK